MTDQKPPVQPDGTPPVAPPPVVPATPPVAPPVTPAPDQQEAPEGYILTERYTGAVQKIETLALAQKDLQSQLTEKASSVELLNSQLADAEASSNTSLGEKDAKITELQGQLAELTTQNSVLKALEVKIGVIKEMGRPDLLPIVEHLPNTADPEALKEALTAMAGTVDNAVKARSEQLLSGVVETPSISAATVPQTAEGWIKHIESLPLGSKERDTAFEDYGKFLDSVGAL